MKMKLKNLDADINADTDTDTVTIEAFGSLVTVEGVPKVIRKGLKWYFKGHGYWSKRRAIQLQRSFVNLLVGSKLRANRAQALGTPEAPERGLYGHNVKDPKRGSEKDPNKRKDLN